jgi:hypothetical protein
VITHRTRPAVRMAGSSRRRTNRPLTPQTIPD